MPLRYWVIDNWRFRKGARTLKYVFEQFSNLLIITYKSVQVMTILSANCFRMRVAVERDKISSLNRTDSF